MLMSQIHVYLEKIFFSPPHLPFTTFHLYNMLQMFLQIFSNLSFHSTFSHNEATGFNSRCDDDTIRICGNYCVFTGFQRTCVYYRDIIFNSGRKFADTRHSNFRLHHTNWPLCSSCILQTFESLHQSYAYLQLCHAGVWPIHTYLCR